MYRCSVCKHEGHQCVKGSFGFERKKVVSVRSKEFEFRDQDYVLIVDAKEQQLEARRRSQPVIVEETPANLDSPRPKSIEAMPELDENIYIEEAQDLCAQEGFMGKVISALASTTRSEEQCMYIKAYLVRAKLEHSPQMIRVMKLRWCQPGEHLFIGTAELALILQGSVELRHRKSRQLVMRFEEQSDLHTHAHGTQLQLVVAELSALLLIERSDYQIALKQMKLESARSRMGKLMSLPIFACLRRNDVQDLYMNSTEVTLPRHRVIYQENEQLNHVWVILEGEVLTIAQRSCILSAGDILGMWEMMNGARSECRAVSEQCSILAIECDTWRHLLQANKGYARRLARFEEMRRSLRNGVGAVKEAKAFDDKEVLEHIDYLELRKRKALSPPEDVTFLKQTIRETYKARGYLQKGRKYLDVQGLIDRFERVIDQEERTRSLHIFSTLRPELTQHNAIPELKPTEECQPRESPRVFRFRMPEPVSPRPPCKSPLRSRSHHYHTTTPRGLAELPPESTQFRTAPLVSPKQKVLSDRPLKLQVSEIRIPKVQRLKGKLVSSMVLNASGLEQIMVKKLGQRAS